MLTEFRCCAFQPTLLCEPLDFSKKPFVMMVIGVLLIYGFPDLVTWLPRQMK